MSPTDLFGEAPPGPHKTTVRERLMELPEGTKVTYEDAYRICRDIPNRPETWQASIRDELHRLWRGACFTQSDDRSVYTRTSKK